MKRSTNGFVMWSMIVLASRRLSRVTGRLPTRCFVRTSGSGDSEDISAAEIESWARSLTHKPSTRRKALVLLHAVFERGRRAYGLSCNPADGVEKPAVPRSDGIDVYSPDEITALVEAAASPQDGALFLTAAFAGLRRGELLALTWRDIDIPNSTLRVRRSYSGGQITTPKSGKVRSVPLAPSVASALTRLRTREIFVEDGDFVFPSAAGQPLDASALRRRYAAARRRAQLRQLRFHDLRHTFGTRMIAKADIRRVQEWMGHADVQTTMKYLHFVPRDSDAALVAAAFETA